LNFINPGFLLRVWLKNKAKFFPVFYKVGRLLKQDLMHKQVSFGVRHHKIGKVNQLWEILTIT